MCCCPTRGTCVCLRNKKKNSPPSGMTRNFTTLKLNQQTASCLRRVVQNTPVRFGISAETKPRLEVFRQLLFKTQQTPRLWFKEKDKERKAKRSSSPRRDSLLCRPLQTPPPPAHLLPCPSPSSLFLSTPAAVPAH